LARPIRGGILAVKIMVTRPSADGVTVEPGVPGIVGVAPAISDDPADCPALVVG